MVFSHRSAVFRYLYPLLSVGLWPLHQHGPQFLVPTSVEVRLAQGIEADGGVPLPYHYVCRFRSEGQLFGTYLSVHTHEHDSETSTSPPSPWLNNLFLFLVARGLKVTRPNAKSIHAGMHTARGDELQARLLPLSSSRATHPYIFQPAPSLYLPLKLSNGM